MVQKSQSRKNHTVQKQNICMISMGNKNNHSALSRTKIYSILLDVKRKQKEDIVNRDRF